MLPLEQSGESQLHTPASPLHAPTSPLHAPASPSHTLGRTPWEDSQDRLGLAGKAECDPEGQVWQSVEPLPLAPLEK